jgi:serine/threonine protein kinase
MENDPTNSIVSAPEVIRGEKYDEKADVYAFGVIMWEVLTRKVPYEGRNFMNVSLDVLEGRRPSIPLDCPTSFKKVMKACWHAKPAKRPSMDRVIQFFEAEVGGDDSAADSV